MSLRTELAKMRHYSFHIIGSEQSNFLWGKSKVEFSGDFLLTISGLLWYS
jgi:hypothetical protein